MIEIFIWLMMKVVDGMLQSLRVDVFMMPCGQVVYCSSYADYSFIMC